MKSGFSQVQNLLNHSAKTAPEGAFDGSPEGNKAERILSNESQMRVGYF